MDLTNFSLDELQFELTKKQNELQSIDMSTFTLNPQVMELIDEISEIQEAIEERNKED